MNKRSSKHNMSREDMSELYRDLKKTLGGMKQAAPAKEPLPQGFIGELVKGIRAGLKSDEKKERGSVAAKQPLMALEPEEELHSAGYQNVLSGRETAIALLVLIVAAKVVLSALEFSGVGTVQVAQASLAPARPVSMQQPFSPEEVEILKKLDLRRSELAERERALEEREQELKDRDGQYAARMTQLKEMTERLRVEREKDQKKRTAQLDQLANVYSSMNPQEAATLMQQLDVSIALALLERMPEKRIGQILALMQPERALTLTKMLSAR